MRFDGDAWAACEFMAARVEAALRPGRLDCAISFGRLPLSSEWRENPLRRRAIRPGGYPTLRAKLESTSLDSIAIAVASSGEGEIVWDGHRRLETYRAARRPDIPAWRAEFWPGRGVVSVPPSVSSGTGTGPD